MASGPKVKPSVAWVIIGLIIMVLGPIGCTALLADSFFDVVNAIDDASRRPVPGTYDVDADGTIALAVIAPTESVLGINPFQVTVTDDSGSLVSLDNTDFDITGDSEGDYFELIGTFSADGGRYTIDVDGPPASELVIAPVPSNIVRNIGWGFAIGGIGAIVGFLMALIAGIRRRSNRKKMQLGGVGPVGGPGVPPPPGAPQYGTPEGYGAPQYGAPQYGAPPAAPGAYPPPATPDPYAAPPAADPYAAPPAAPDPYAAPPAADPYAAPPAAPDPYAAPPAEQYAAPPVADPPAPPADPSPGQYAAPPADAPPPPPPPPPTGEAAPAAPAEPAPPAPPAPGADDLPPPPPPPPPPPG